MCGGKTCTCYYMLTSLNGTIFRVTSLWCGQFAAHRWIPLTKASDAELWLFLWSAPEPTIEQTMETLVIWDASSLIMTSQWWIFVTLLHFELWNFHWVIAVRMLFELLMALFSTAQTLGAVWSITKDIMICVSLYVRQMSDSNDQWNRHRSDGCPTRTSLKHTWWRHQTETFSALLALCGGNSTVTGEFPSQRPVTRRFDVFFDLGLNKRSSKQSRRGWFEMPLRSLWRHCNATVSVSLFNKLKYCDGWLV